MQFQVLGTLEVVREGAPLELGGPKQRALLAMLLIHANRVVATEQLLEALWDEPPSDALRSRLWVYVSNLRALLEPGRDRPGSGEVLLTRSSGYVLEVDDHDLDSARFEAQVAEGRSLLDVDPEQATVVLRDALATWRGRAYEDVSYEDFAQEEIRRLTELRVGALEDRIDADLRTGQAGQLVGELEALCRGHPLRERLRALHMLALYRAGRQAEALRAYQRTRRQLADELGLDPSPELAALETRILAQDPSLDRPAPTADGGLLGGVGGYELRGQVGEGPLGTVHRAYQNTVGREVALKVIRGPVADTPAFIARFDEEARRIAGLEHPHVVALYDWWREPGAAYLAMPLLGGGDLRRFLAGGPGLAAALGMIEQVGGALAHAHRHGEPHGNLKPANVLVDADGNGYLADFGLAGTPEHGSLAPERRPSGPPDAASDIYALGMLARHVLVAASGAGLPRPLAEVLDRSTAPHPSRRHDHVEDLLRELRQATGLDVVAMAGPAPPSTPVRNPYKGLRAFQQSDAEDFFGREAVVARLIEAVATTPLVAVVGPSGSGKSSAVKAGLLPRLQQGDRPALVTEMFPGAHPFEELETALLRVAARSADGMLEDLTADRRGLVRVAKRIVPDDSSELVLVIDQFEELFSLVDQEATRALFLASLVETASDPRSPLRVVLTLRADFFDRPLEYPGVEELLETGLVPVGVPSEDELARAVSGPARRVGLHLESGLVAAVVGDVVGQPGGLPLLQYALTELVERRESDVLTVEAYRRSGGVAGALGARAEELYAALGPMGREAARQAFLRLVAVEDGGEGTRRRVRRSELAELDVDQGELETALHRFGAHRLISFDRDPVTRGPTVEVAHEALLRAWDRLAGWIDDRRDELVVARRVGAAAREWDESGADRSFLLRGARLEQAETWLDDTDLAPTAAEVAYLDASREQRRAEEATSRRRRRWTLGVLSAGLVVLGITTAVAVTQRAVAQAEARQEEVRRLAASSELALDEDPERAVLLALEAAEVSGRAGEPIQQEAVVALQQAVQASRLEMRFDQYVAVGFDPAGEAVLEELLYPRQTPDDWPGAVVSPDGRLAAERVLDADNETGEIVVWEVATRREVARLVPRAASGAGMYVTGPGLQWHPDGRLLAAEVSDRTTTTGRLKVWETGSWDEVASIPMSFVAPEIAPDSIDRVGAFPDSDTLAVLDPGGQIVLLDPGTGDEIDRIDHPGADAASTLVDYERDRLLTGTWEPPRSVEQWDLDTGELQWSTQVADGSGIAVSKATGMVASFGADGNVRLHDPETGSVIESLRGHLSPVMSATFSPDGSLLVSRSLDETLVWDISPGGPRAVGTIRIDAGPRPLPRSLSPTDTEVAVMYGGGLSRYRLSDGEVIGDTQGMVSTEFPSPISPDWGRVGVLDHEGRGRVQDLATGDRLLELPSCGYPLALSSDGGMVVVNGRGLCSPEDTPDADWRSRVVAVPTGEEVLDLGERYINAALGTAFNPAGTFEADRYLAVIFTPEEEVLEVYDTVTEALVARLQFSHLAVSVAFDPSGRYVGVGVVDGGVRVLDLAAVVDGTPAEEALVFNRVVGSGPILVKLNTDGLMATSSLGSLRLWDIHSGDHLLDIPVRIEDFPVAVFTHDGETLFYRDLGPRGDEVLRRFPLDPDELIGLAQSRATRDLTPGECERYHLDC